MKWETPAFVEINMSAEIGGYQSDFSDRDPRDPVVHLAPRATPPNRPTAASGGPRERRSGSSSQAPVEDSGSGLRRRRRIPAVELRLPQLPEGAPAGRPRRARARRSRVAVSADGESLVPDQRLARDPRARSKPAPTCGRARSGTRRSPASCSPTAISTTASACCRCASRTRWSSTRPRPCAPASPRATCSTGRSSASPSR